jgi:peroxiredoxin
MVMETRTATVGTRAPDFSLPCTGGPGGAPRQVCRDDYADRWLILVFYSRDFSLL